MSGFDEAEEGLSMEEEEQREKVLHTPNLD